MYLPTDLATVFSIMLTHKRKERAFWLEMAIDPVGDSAIKRLQGQIWLLRDLRDAALGEGFAYIGA